MDQAELFHRWNIFRSSSETFRTVRKMIGNVCTSLAMSREPSTMLEKCSKRKKCLTWYGVARKNCTPHLLFSRIGAALKLAPYLAQKCINSVGLITIKSKAFLLVTQINNTGNSIKSVSRRKCGLYYQPWTILF